MTQNPTFFGGAKMPDTRPERLYYYSDWEHKAWAENPKHFRKLTGSKKTPGRVPPAILPDWMIPEGYARIGLGMAQDGVVRISQK